VIQLSSDIFIFILIFGALIGSFLNVVILRVPEKTFFKHSRSVCPKCGALVPIWLNIPVVSWLLLRGKSNCCRTSISIQYPLVELSTMIIFGLFYTRHPFLGWSFDSLLWNYDDFLRFMHGVTFTSVLLACSVIDIRLMIIPDVLSLGMIGVSPLVAWLHPELKLVDSLGGVLLGGGFLYAIAWFYWLIRKQYGMGFGDVKLLAAIGGWIGYQGVFPTLFLGSIIGSIMGVVILMLAQKFSWKAKVPFGPFLAAGAVLYLWYGLEVFFAFGLLSQT